MGEAIVGLLKDSQHRKEAAQALRSKMQQQWGLVHWLERYRQILTGVVWQQAA